MNFLELECYFYQWPRHDHERRNHELKLQIRPAEPLHIIRIPHEKIGFLLPVIVLKKIPILLHI